MKIKLFKRSHVGGPNSGVTGYWLIEWKLDKITTLTHGRVIVQQSRVQISAVPPQGF